MEKLNNLELERISGGGIAWSVLAGIVAGGLFVIGTLDGYLRPYACRK